MRPSPGSVLIWGGRTSPLPFAREGDLSSPRETNPVDWRTGRLADRQTCFSCHYRFNPETRLAEAYTVQEPLTRQAPTGRKTVQLKKDERLDEKTGKFYRWCGLGGAAANGTANAATPAQTAAALGKLMRGDAIWPTATVSAAAVSHRATETAEVIGNLFLQPPASNLRTPASSLQPPVSSLQSPVSSLQSPASSLQSPS